MPTYLLLLLLAGMLSASIAQGQAREYVVNGDFEQMRSCPVEPGDITLATGWQGNEGTPDYLHTCSEQQRDSVNILGNFVGYRKAYAGMGCVGLYLLRYSIDHKVRDDYATNELVYTKLRQPLTVAKTYRVRLWLSLADSSFIASDSIYVCFSATPTFSKQHQLIEPAFSKGIPVANHHDWQLLELNVTPTEPYTHCYIGLPRKKITYKVYRTKIRERLQTGKLLQQRVLVAYYYLDKVSITERE